MPARPALLPQGFRTCFAVPNWLTFLAGGEVVCVGEGAELQEGGLESPANPAGVPLSLTLSHCNPETEACAGLS